MKKLASLSLILFCLVSICAFGQANYGLKAFDEVNVSGNIELILEESTTEKLTYTTEGISEDKLNIINKNGVLKLKISNGIYKKDQKAYVTLSYKTLRAVKAFAGAQVSGSNDILGDKLELKAHSGGGINLQLELNAIEVGTYEGGTIKLTGMVEAQKITSNTGGSYNGRNLVSSRAYAKASLGGSVEYVGSPNELTRSTSLGGTVKRKGGS